MNLRGFDYFTDRPSETAGLTRLATLMRSMRTEARACGDAVIALDNGDSLQGSPVDVEAMRNLEAPHIFYRVLAQMGYDAAGLGNHDFNFDLNHLEASTRNAPLPVLCANARRIDGGAFPVQPWTVIKRTLAGVALRIGVFSVLPPQTMVWDADHLSDHMSVDDIMTGARRSTAALRAQGADIIVALAHTGLGEKDEEAGQENALWPLSKIDEIDAIVAGHTHLLLPDPRAAPNSQMARGMLNQTPVVMPGVGAEHLGVIDLNLVHTGGSWSVVQSQAKLYPACQKEDPTLAQMTDALHVATRRNLSRRIGATQTPLHSYFDLIAPSSALALMAQAQADMLCRLPGIPEGLPVLSAVAPAKLGGRGGPHHYLDIPAGGLCLRHAFDLCYFSNRLAAVILTGAEIATWIEMSASIYTRVTPGGSTKRLFDRAWAPHNCDVLYGLTYELDLSKPARFDHQGRLVNSGAKRVVRLLHDGKPIAEDQRFVVALSSFRANGGGNIAGLRHAHRLNIQDILVRDALLDYLKSDGRTHPFQQDVFTFSALGNTTVSHQTGPGARAHIDQIAEFCAGTDGYDDAGFLNLNLKL